MNLCVYTCFVYLQPFCVTLDFKLFIDSIHILFLLYLPLSFWDFTIKNLQDFIKIYRALIKDIFPVAEANPENLSNRLSAEAQEKHTEHVLPNLADQKCTSSTISPSECPATQSSIWVLGRSRAQKGGTKYTQNNPINHGNLSGPW